jgi:hypothetical protein
MLLTNHVRREKMSKVAYTGVVLDEASQDMLRELMSPILDNTLRDIGFVERNARGQRLSHHLTLCLGPATDRLRDYLGKRVTMAIVGWGYTNKALAVQIRPFNLLDLTSVKNPHVTVAVNPVNEGAPKHSNDISVWTKFGEPILVAGTVEEVCH